MRIKPFEILSQKELRKRIKKNPCTEKELERISPDIPIRVFRGGYTRQAYVAGKKHYVIELSECDLRKKDNEEYLKSYAHEFVHIYYRCGGDPWRDEPLEDVVEEEGLKLHKEFPELLKDIVEKNLSLNSKLYLAKEKEDRIRIISNYLNSHDISEIISKEHPLWNPTLSKRKIMCSPKDNPCFSLPFIVGKEYHRDDKDKSKAYLLGIVDNLFGNELLLAFEPKNEYEYHPIRSVPIEEMFSPGKEEKVTPK